MSVITNVNGVEQIQLRKLVSVGNGAHTVCIPRRWVEKLGFTNNDMVRMELLDNKIMIKRMDMELIRRYSDPTTIDMMKFANSPGEGIHMEKVLME